MAAACTGAEPIGRLHVEKTAGGAGSAGFRPVGRGGTVTRTEVPCF